MISKDEYNNLFMEFVIYNNEDSFMKLYDYSSKWLYNYIYNVVYSKEVAKDLFQETWLITIDKKNNFSPRRGSINNLLFTIAKNLAYQHMAKQKKSDNVLQNDFKHVTEKIEKNTPELQQIEDEKLEIIKQAVKNLKVKYQDVIYLYYFSSLSIKEIAQKLNKNENTIKTLLKRGKEKLENELIKLGFEQFE